MAERYLRVYTSENNLYIDGSPVIISAGALLKDNQTGKILAQLKIKNIGLKPIKALRVKFKAYDVSGACFNESVTHDYLDLNVQRDEEFGQKTLISMPDASTRSFSVVVKEVIFSDDIAWKNEAVFDFQLPNAETLLAILNEPELEQQYKLKYGHDCSVFPVIYKDLWYCACGAVNRTEEEFCHCCRKSQNTLFEFNKKKLRSEMEERLEHEKCVAEEEKAKSDAQKKKNIKAAIIICSAVAVITAAIFMITHVVIPNHGYNSALRLYKDGKYAEAITAFAAMDGYKDSEEQIERCETAIKDADYNAAVKLYNEEQYEEAMAAFTAMEGYKDSVAQIEKCKEAIEYIKYGSIYENAISLYNDGQYIKAMDIFETLEYKDSKEQKVKCEIALLEDAKVGSVVYYGKYEQDNDTTNGQENIEWIVLDRSSDKMLLLSKYALEFRSYHITFTEVTWETCTLRTWMNGEFLNNAFSGEEQARMLTTMVKAEKNPNYSTDPGSATNDKVFLIGISDVNKYFTSNESRLCVPTAYAIAQWTWEGKNNTSQEAYGWWLRNPGFNSKCAAFIDYGGSINDEVVDNITISVRPAIWINIST